MSSDSISIKSSWHPSEKQHLLWQRNLMEVQYFIIFILTPIKYNAEYLKATVPFETAITYLLPVNSLINFSNFVTQLPELLTHIHYQGNP